MKNTVKVMFVCMGNICRSPTAHAVMRKLVLEQGLEDHIIIESSGTHAYHVGNPPDPRSQATAMQKGIDMSDLRAQKISITDYDEFDWILAMDEENLELINYYAPPDHTAQCALLMDFSVLETYSDQHIVPDPYYGGNQGFENVFYMVEDACAGFLQHIQKSDDL